MDFSQENTEFPDPSPQSDSNDQSQAQKAAEKIETSSLPNDSQRLNDQTVVTPAVQPHQETEGPLPVQGPSVAQDKTLQQPAQGFGAPPPPPPPPPFNQITSPYNNPASAATQQAYAQGYPLPGQTYPPPGQIYPPPGPAYPPPGQTYPPPGQTYPPPGQYYSPPAYKKPPKPLGRLAYPLPLWAFLGGIGLIIILLLVLHLTGTDWGDGAANASHAAVAIGILLLLALLVRSWNGMASTLNPNRRRQYIVSFLCIILVFVYSGISQALIPTLHTAQGQSLAGQQQWQTALHEYTLAGEKAPDGVDLAGVYTSWGLALNKAQRYNQALTKFNIVIDQFNSQATKDQVGKAQSGSVDARLALGQQSMQAKNYAAASGTYDTILSLSYCNDTCHNKAQSGSVDARLALGQQSIQAKDYTAASGTYDTILNLSYCNDACHKQVSSLDATAYYDQGETHLQAQDYNNASTAFDVVLTRFSSAPEAKQLHGDMAKALLGKGKGLRTSSCSTAIPTYQRVSNDYADTPEGQSAKQDLDAPQPITGNFSNIDPNVNFNQMGLAQGLHGGMGQDALFSAWDNAGQKTAIQGNGDFSFNSVAQGDYDLLWHGTGGNSEYIEFIYSQTLLTPTYVAHVGPLCPVTMGQVTNVLGATTPQ